MGIDINISYELSIVVDFTDRFSYLDFIDCTRLYRLLVVIWYGIFDKFKSRCQQTEKTSIETSCSPLRRPYQMMFYSSQSEMKKYPE